MKISFRHISLTVLLSGMLASGATVAQEQEINNQPAIYGGASWFNLDSQREIRNDDGVMFGAEVPVTDRWSGTVEYYRNRANNIYTLGNSKTDYYRAGGNYHFNKVGAFQPYLALGLGRIKTVPNTAMASDRHFGGDIGLGVKVPLFEGLFLRGDAKMIIAEENHQDFVAGLSVGYMWGSPRMVATGGRQEIRDRDGDGVPDDRDMCPNTPPGVQVDERGCPLDSDGDGVPDHLDRCPNTDPTHAVDEHGCPIMESSEVRQRLEVRFDFDKYDVKQEFQGEIREFAEFMRTHDSTTATIEGHTDSIGTEEYNQGLSERRANAVLEALVNQYNIQRNRLRAIGFGESRPVAPNTTEAGRAQNRRTEAVVEAEVSEARRR